MYKDPQHVLGSTLCIRIHNTGKHVNLIHTGTYSTEGLFIYLTFCINITVLLLLALWTVS